MQRKQFVEHKVNKFYNLCRNNTILERSASFLLKSSTSFPQKRNHHAYSTKQSNVANLSDFKLSPEQNKFLQLGLSFCPTPKFADPVKIAMIMNSFADVYVYMNIFSQMEMPTNNLCTTTAVKLVGLHPIAETPLYILFSITLETSTTISFLTHHIALSPTFLSNNKKPLGNYPTTQTL